MKCGRTDPSAAERPSVGCGRSGRDRLCSVIVGVFGTRLALFGISPKLPEYLPRTLAWVHAHHRRPDLKRGVKMDNTNQMLLEPQLFVKKATEQGTIELLDKQLRQKLKEVTA